MKKILLIAVLVCVIFTVMTPIALANDWDGWTVVDTTGSPQQSVTFGQGIGNDGWKRWLTDMLWTICGYGLVNDVQPMLTYNVLSDSQVASFFDKGVTAFEGIAGGLLFLYAMLDMIERIQAEMFTVDHFLRFMLKVMVGFLLITNLKVMLTGALGVGISIVETIMEPNTGEGGPTIVNAYIVDQIKDIEKANVMGKIDLTMRFLVPYLFAIIAKLVVIFTTLGRLIEIGVRAALAPLAMANVVGKGLDSPGMRYFKKFIAICLHAAVIVAILMVSAYLRSSVNIPMDGFFAGIIISLSSCALIIQCGSWANDIVGV